MQQQWDEMHRTRKPTFVLCGEPQGDVLNLYVHGYSAFFNQQQLGHFKQQLAGIEGSTNLMLFWPAGHFLENLFAPFKDVIASMLGGGGLGAATVGLGKAIAYFLDHYKSVETRVDEVAKSLLPELANYLHRESLTVRRINLIGHSLGARILVKSLLASPETARELPLNNVLLMGGAICTSSPWEQVAAPLTGRVINCHSSKDWALAMKPDTERCIGRYAIPVTPALKTKLTNVHLASFDHAAYWPQLKTVVQYTDLLQERRGMMRFDPRSSQVRFAEEDIDLFPVLMQARPDELKFLAELMSQKRSASIDASVRDPRRLAIELQRMGGDSLMNIARGHGVNYRQIAQDVAGRLGIKGDEPIASVALADLEAQVAEKLIEQYKDKLSQADRQLFDAELRAAAQKEQGLFSRFAVGRSATAALSGTALAGLSGFMLRRGAASAIPVVGQALAAAMLLVSGVRAFSGPAYSITTLAVLVVGVIRQRMEREALNQELDLVVQVVEAFDLPRDTVMRTVVSDC
ncbi:MULTISPECIES: DUF726 domain-containing protein [Pseudomonas]|uniref:DUF726 domain-containing protein n=1 Tax=Pseudomonas poae TaxID=200451 RepID=A0AAP2WGF7_9PSED|nr:MULTISPECIES: DUF726 domain-containing protein [Pseudomonas]ELQ15486.1 hypothetical protein A986_16051 [Pseudomonas fluorescens BRIP34879]KTC38014.1 hypothetical protein AO260_19185 [Pseudomonas sp. ABAC21]KRP51324.1 hypothetical protein TU75_11060 [Pseudomonas poae]MBC3199274.1 DUF726 domain-containing protein [Pseudomonas poae]MCF5654107.1 DUF726 domain-containing protein [Pseudomonas poae]